MVRTADQTARAAAATQRNAVGMCLQVCRGWADIGPYYPDATTAWHHATNRRLGDRTPPRGSMVYWIGGSRGHGHIAVPLDDHGLQIRSTDAGGSGIVATRSLGWFDQNWPSLRYVGWAPNVNGVTIPGIDGEDEDEMNADDWKRFREIVKEEIKANNDNIVNQVWKEEFSAQKPDGSSVKKPTSALLKETWQRVAKGL